MVAMALLDFLDFSKAARHRRVMIEHAKEAVAKKREEAEEAEKGLRSTLSRTNRFLRSGLADGLAWRPRPKKDDDQ